MLNTHKILQLKAQGGKLTPVTQEFLSDSDPEVRREAVAHLENIPSDILRRLVHDRDREVVLEVLQHPDLFEPHLAEALKHEDPVVHAAVASHRKASPALLQKILDHESLPLETKRLAVSNPHHDSETLGKTLERALRGDNEDDRQLALEALAHPNTDDRHRADYLNFTKDILHKKIAATSLKSHSNILSMLNSESVPYSVKLVLLRNPNFDTNDSWKLTDHNLRQMAREVTHDEP